MTIDPDGEIQTVLAENRRLLAAIGADKGVPNAGSKYAGPEIWSMYKRTSEELQKSTKEHQKVKKSLRDTLTQTHRHTHTHTPHAQVKKGLRNTHTHTRTHAHSRTNTNTTHA